MSDSGCTHSRLVDRHFVGRLAPADERDLRSHLPSCATCTKRYQRHLMLSSLLPGALQRAERLGRGLGVGTDPVRPRWPLAVMVAGATALALMFVGPRLFLAQEEGFNARGPTKAHAPHLSVFQVIDGGVAPVAGVVAPNAELAFGYSNPTGKKYLLVFAVDEHGHVYWYHPSWQRPDQNPSGIEVRPSEGIVELPEAIGHSFDGTSLTVHALFTDETLSVREIEARLAARQPLELGVDDVSSLRVQNP